MAIYLSLQPVKAGKLRASWLLHQAGLAAKLCHHNLVWALTPQFHPYPSHILLQKNIYYLQLRRSVIARRPDVWSDRRSNLVEYYFNRTLQLLLKIRVKYVKGGLLSVALSLGFAVDLKNYDRKFFTSAYARLLA